jgi:dipeptidase E
MVEAQRWAGGISNPAYAIDDQTAISVVAGVVDFVSEGHWEKLQTLSAEPDQGLLQ